MRTIEKIIQKKFDTFRLQFVEIVIFSKKKSNAPSDPKMTLNVTRPNKVPHICCNTTRESQI